MKFYRAIEFSKLQYLLTNDQYLYWINQDLLFDDPQKVNWWLKEDNGITKKERHKILSTISKNDNQIFFNKSAEFNSVSGGRFNPARSFGGVYCANSPFVSALEVLYHYITRTIDTVMPISKNRNAVQSSLNRKLGTQLDVVIAAFEFELNELNKTKDNFYCLNDHSEEGFEELKKIFGNLGFNRYLSEQFDRNFIFGNNYEISHILGCHLHTINNHGFKVPSARLDFEVQDMLNLRNFFIPEKVLDNITPSLTGNYIEYEFKFDVQLNENGKYEIRMPGIEQQFDCAFQLEMQPNRNNAICRKQIISYEHGVELANKKLREVHLQRFVKNRD